MATAVQTPPVQTPVVDPATASGARANPLYIGPTNFGNIQKQYTPYQIEQATTRDVSGNIFWKEGVNIADVPKAQAVAPFKAPTVAPMPSTSNLPTSPTVPAANVTKAASPMDAFAQAQSAASETYLTGIKGSIDTLLAQQQQMQTAAKDAAQQEVSGLKNKLLNIVNGGNQAQTALTTARDLFKVEESIKTLTMIQDKVANATNALNQGLIYEEGRPVRMQLLVGRSAELKKQGIATIGALQASAEVVRGNIDLARAYASDTIAAIKQDNAEKTDALNTLLDLANDNLIQLSEDEKATIDRRMGLLDSENTRLDKQKDQLLELAIQYPNAFASGSVTFTDSPEQALQKMLPTMSAQEKQLFDLDVKSKQAAITKAGSSGSGGSGSVGSDIVQNMAADVGLLKKSINPETGKLFTDQEIRVELLKEYGGKLKPTELNAVVDQALQGTPKTDALTVKLADPADAMWLADQGIAAGDPDYYRFQQMTKSEVLQELAKPKAEEAKGPGILQRAKERAKDWFTNFTDSFSG